MEFSIKSTHPDKQRTACTVVGIFENGQLTAAAAMLDRACGNALRTLIEHGDFEGRSGASLMLFMLCAPVMTFQTRSSQSSGVSSWNRSPMLHTNTRRGLRQWSGLSRRSG